MDVVRCRQEDSPMKRSRTRESLVQRGNNRHKPRIVFKIMQPRLLKVRVRTFACAPWVCACACAHLVCACSSAPCVCVRVEELLGYVHLRVLLGCVRAQVLVRACVFVCV